LPQTGQANQSSISLIGFVLLALGSIIGWLGFSKKKIFRKITVLNEGR
jgi:LPXTG-motif cell wall-anchored protein